LRPVSYLCQERKDKIFEYSGENYGYQKAFGSLGSSEEVSEAALSEIVIFVFELYGIKQKKSGMEKPMSTTPACNYLLRCIR
jgi:hypothetical protein